MKMNLEECDFAALRRAISRCDLETDKLGREGNYDAMFPEGDAKSLRKILVMLEESRKKFSERRSLHTAENAVARMEVSYAEKLVERTRDALIVAWALSGSNASPGSGHAFDIARERYQYQILDALK